VYRDIVGCSQAGDGPAQAYSWIFGELRVGKGSGGKGEGRTRGREEMGKGRGGERKGRRRERERRGKGLK